MHHIDKFNFQFYEAKYLGKKDLKKQMCDTLTINIPNALRKRDETSTFALKGKGLQIE